MPTCPACQTPLPEGAAFCSQCGAGTPSGAAPGPAGEIDARLRAALGPQYQVRRLLGQGGFALVFEVWDAELERRLALKVLRPDLAWTTGMLDRFRHEARILARLQDPHILPIHFVGEAGGLTYYAMPFVEGRSLGDLLRSDGALDPGRAVAIIRPVLEALEHAHSLGLVHRDVKPENVMLEKGTGRVVLVDFGIAKQVNGHGPGLTQTGLAVGTPHYMSPEQALGQGNIDHRADIYAAGAMLYQMVTGTPPFEGETSQEIVGKHIAEPVPRPSARNARIPGWLSDVIVRCLAKRPGERFQSARRVLEALDEGRKSGPQQAISADSLARRLRAEDQPTAVIPSRERPAAADAPTTPLPVAGRRRGRIGWLLPLLLLLAAAVAWFWLSRPRLMVVNQLVEPVRLSLAGTERELGPGDTLRVVLSRGRQAILQWFVVQPRSPGGRTLGDPMQGTFTEARPQGRLEWHITPASAGDPFFAPLITNAASQGLRIIVNAGLQGQVDCDCSVPAGAEHAHLGYYRLYANSRVRAIAPGGRSALFQDLAAHVDSTDGSVGLRFERKDFQ